MRAAVLHGPGDVRVEDIPLPRAPPGWVLVKSLAVGICGTDKAFYRGTYRPPRLPLVPGHEAAGVVVAAPPEWGHLVGKLVVPEINMVDPGDMWREPCRSGFYIHCPPPLRRTLGIDTEGAMAEYFAAPPHLLHRAEGLDPVMATLVEPLAAVLKAFTVEPPRPGDRVAVVGTGLLGLLATEVLHYMGYEPVIIARRGSVKAEVFRSRGYRVVYVDEAEEAARRLGRWGLGFDVVFEASGTPEGLDTAVRITRPGGVVHVKSTHGLRAALDQTLMVVREQRLVATRCGTGREFEEALRLLRSGAVSPPPIRVVEGLENAPGAFRAALGRDVFRVVLRIGRAPWETGWSPGVAQRS